ncbi:alpha/beta hydrolase, partial [Klebsiella pneumoniae]
PGASRSEATFSSRWSWPRRRRPAVNIHDFNNLLEEAVYRFAQIVHDGR